MKKKLSSSCSSFEKQARKIVSQAFNLCEDKIKASNGDITLELKILSASVMSFEKAATVLIAAIHLNK